MTLAHILALLLTFSCCYANVEPILMILPDHSLLCEDVLLPLVIYLRRLRELRAKLCYVSLISLTKKKKIIMEIGLRWAAIIPFSVVPCLDSVDFYACLTPSSVSHIKYRQFRSFPKQIWNLKSRLYHTTLTKSSTFFHWKARAILRLWVLNKRRCYFWHMHADWSWRLGTAFADWLVLLSLSSAPDQSYTWLVDYRAPVMHWL